MRINYVPSWEPGDAVAIDFVQRQHPSGSRRRVYGSALLAPNWRYQPSCL